MKYFLTVVAVCLRTAYSLNKGIIWRVLAAFFSVVAAVFCTYWDFVYDWGLLNRHSKNAWLRDKLLVPHKKVYFGAMVSNQSWIPLNVDVFVDDKYVSKFDWLQVLNVLLRFAWLQTVLDFRFSFMHTQTLIAVVASLEIIRRGVWNFFR